MYEHLFVAWALVIFAIACAGVLEGIADNYEIE